MLKDHKNDFFPYLRSEMIEVEKKLKSYSRAILDHPLDITEPKKN